MGENNHSNKEFGVEIRHLTCKNGIVLLINCTLKARMHSFGLRRGPRVAVFELRSSIGVKQIHPENSFNAQFEKWYALRCQHGEKTISIRRSPQTDVHMLFYSRTGGTYWYSPQVLLRWLARSGFLPGQTPLPPGCPVALSQREIALLNSCLSKISELPASAGCQRCPQWPVSMETSEMSASSHYNFSL